MGAQLQGLIAALIGAAAWRGPDWTVALSLAVPVLVVRQPSRRLGGLTAFAYYGTASLPVLPALQAFAPETSALWYFAAWLLASGVLTVPWIALWSTDVGHALWRVPAAHLLSVVPPIGLIGWASPLTATGILFPGTGWLGLAAAMLLPALVAAGGHTKLTLGAAIGCAAISNGLYSAPTAPHAWVGLTTNFAAIGNAPDPIGEFDQSERVQSLAMRSTGRVVLLPESSIPRWNEATKSLWTPTLDRARQAGTVIVVGVGMSDSNHRLNGVIATDSAEPSFYQQRIPVPVAMWNPLRGSESFALNLLSPATIWIAGRRVAPLICYEQLLVLPMLQAAATGTDVWLGFTNAAWTKRTIVPAPQQRCLRAWSRLFGIPVISSVNQ